MPRPGPRPYECVRRAWHSDRHQPMRGSIIQQIFRVVHESHSSATKKNKEWQEKLPIVVLKAEEIMYSKANSEAEYMELDTIWDRVNDAVNTIIRRDESTETGVLLPPCVEAALNLGCVPVRASRSQRNNNPRAYLSPRAPEPGSTHPTISENMTIRNQSTFARPHATVTSTQLVSEPNRPVMGNSFPTASSNFPLSYEKFPIRNDQFIPMESNFPLNAGSVYPLHYGTDFQLDVSQLEVRTPKDFNPIIVGRPIFSSIPECAEVGSLQRLFPNENASNRTDQPHFRDNHVNETEAECDLSLRLGLGKCLTRDSDDVCSISSQEGRKFSNLSPSQNKEFPFFPVRSSNDPSEFRASEWNPEGEGQNAEAAFRKRKAPFGNYAEDGQFFYVPEHNFNHFSGRMKRPGL